MMDKIIAKLKSYSIQYIPEYVFETLYFFIKQNRYVSLLMVFMKT